MPDREEVLAAAQQFIDAIDEAMADDDDDELVVGDLYAVIVQRDGGPELVVAVPEGGCSRVPLISPYRDDFDRFDFAELARDENATIRLRHYVACHDEEWKP